MELKHGDTLYISGRKGGFFRVGTIAVTYREHVANRKEINRRYQSPEWGKPLPWEGSLADYAAHNRQVGGKDQWLTAEATIIADDGLSMQERYAQRGETLIEAAFGQQVSLEGVAYTLAPDHNDNAKFVPVEG